MSAPIAFRPDSVVEAALARLTSDGTSVSDAVRAAIVQAATRQAERALRAEAAALTADPGDRAETTQVLRDLETLRAW